MFCWKVEGKRYTMYILYPNMFKTLKKGDAGKYF